MDYRVGASLGAQIRLLGADTEVDKEGLRVTLFWKAQTEVDRDYTVFVHLLGPDGTLVSQHDAMPDDGGLPTSVWLEGEFVSDEHVLELPAEIPPGDYRLEVGLYAADTMARLPVLDDSGEVIANSIVLEPVGLEN